ncbi:Vesicle coat complex COPI, gamma subunit, partial [Pseudoloma neurophilia]
MSTRLAQQIKQVFSKNTTSRELTIQILCLVKYLQNSTIDEKNRDSIALSLLRGFSLNDHYLNQLICLAVTQLLPFPNSFIAINILKKNDPLSMRLF